MPEIPVVNVYPQRSPHDDAFIVGNKEGLVALRSAIDEALNDPGGLGTKLSYVADGEGFVILVKRVDTWDSLDGVALPYFGEEYSNGSPSATGPFDVIGKEAYRAAVRHTIETSASADRSTADATGVVS